MEKGTENWDNGRSKASILYVDVSVRFGGTVTSLLSRLACMDRSIYRPMVLCREGPQAEAFRKLGVRTEPVTAPPFPKRARVRVGGLKIVSPFGAVRHLLILYKVIRTALRLKGKERLDLIHGSALFSNLYASVVGLVLRRPVIWHINDVDPLRNLLAFSLLERGVSKIIAISLAIKARLIESGFPEKKVVLLYEPVDSRKFRPMDRLECRKKLGMDPGGVLVGFAGRLDSGKGVDVFISAAARIAGERGDVLFPIAGASSDREYGLRVRSMTESPGLREKILFLGFVEDMPVFLNTLDVLVFPSTIDEGFGLSAAEAGACGVAVVASDVGGVREIVKDGETGLLVPPGDAASLASNVARLVDDPELRRDFGRAAHKRIGSLYSAERHRDKLGELYEQILAR